MKTVSTVSAYSLSIQSYKRYKKPLKRLRQKPRAASRTRLKQGVNETGISIVSLIHWPAISDSKLSRPSPHRRPANLSHQSIRVEPEPTPGPNRCVHAPASRPENGPPRSAEFSR